jgi:hypothetical protein
MSRATRIRPRVFNLLRAARRSFRQTDRQNKGNRSTLSAFRCKSEKKVKLTDTKLKEKKTKAESL